MNHSILTADRTTHLKIVTLALVAGLSITGFGVAASLSPASDSSSVSANRFSVVKAVRTTAYTAREGATIR